MPTPTYDLISEQVLGSAASSITFSSIPGTYKDLVIEIVGSLSVADYIWLQFNSDTGGNYSDTYIYGSGSSTFSARDTNATRAYGGQLGTALSTATFQIMSYANTNVNKTTLARTGAANGPVVQATVSLWRNTGAITSIVASVDNSRTYSAGSTFRLWGVA